MGAETYQISKMLYQIRTELLKIQYNSSDPESSKAALRADELVDEALMLLKGID